MCNALPHSCMIALHNQHGKEGRGGARCVNAERGGFGPTGHNPRKSPRETLTVQYTSLKHEPRGGAPNTASKHPPTGATGGVEHSPTKRLHSNSNANANSKQRPVPERPEQNALIRPYSSSSFPLQTAFTPKKLWPLAVPRNSKESNLTYFLGDSP